jgi:hypothetical protein
MIPIGRVPAGTRGQEIIPFVRVPAGNRGY